MKKESSAPSPNLHRSEAVLNRNLREQRAQRRSFPKAKRGAKKAALAAGAAAIGTALSELQSEQKRAGRTPRMRVSQAKISRNLPDLSSASQVQESRLGSL